MGTVQNTNLFSVQCNCSPSVFLVGLWVGSMYSGDTWRNVFMCSVQHVHLIFIRGEMV